jgi:hypothetical protein
LFSDNGAKRISDGGCSLGLRQHDAAYGIFDASNQCSAIPHRSDVCHDGSTPSPQYAAVVGRVRFPVQRLESVQLHASYLKLALGIVESTTRRFPNAEWQSLHAVRCEDPGKEKRARQRPELTGADAGTNWQDMYRAPPKGIVNLISRQSAFQYVKDGGVVVSAATFPRPLARFTMPEWIRIVVLPTSDSWQKSISALPSAKTYHSKC